MYDSYGNGHKFRYLPVKGKATGYCLKIEVATSIGDGEVTIDSTLWGPEGDTLRHRSCVHYCSTPKRNQGLRNSDSEDRVRQAVVEQ